MEGPIATWYTKNTGNTLEFRNDAARIAERLHDGAVVLEVAPGPGFLAIELAQRGRYRIHGLDISRSFVRIATENAARANVVIDFRHGNAAAMPFDARTFDFIVCRAAFKNFNDPVGALREMHRVLVPGGTALIIDMRNDASNAAIAGEAAKLDVGRLSSLMTRYALRWLRKRAYSKEEFAKMADGVPFTNVEIIEQSIGFEAWMTA